MIVMIASCLGIVLLLHLIAAEDAPAKLDTVTRLYCPPPNFEQLHKREFGYRTAIISEIHGNLALSDFEGEYANYYHGHLLSFYLFHHTAVLGIDKVFVTVLYNQTIYPTGPTVENIYPSSKYCVVDWFKLGVLSWNPTPYGGPVEKWPINFKTGKPSLNRDVYKTERGINPIYKGKIYHLIII